MEKRNSKTKMVLQRISVLRRELKNRKPMKNCVAIISLMPPHKSERINGNTRMPFSHQLAYHAAQFLQLNKDREASDEGTRMPAVIVLPNVLLSPYLLHKDLCTHIDHGHNFCFSNHT